MKLIVILLIPILAGCSLTFEDIIFGDKDYAEQAEPYRARHGLEIGNTTELINLHGEPRHILETAPRFSYLHYGETVMYEYPTGSNGCVGVPVYIVDPITLDVLDARCF